MDPGLPGPCCLFPVRRRELDRFVNPHPIAFTGDFREPADILVLCDMIPNMPEEEKRNNLRDFVESGKGVVVLHHAIIDHQGWPWWYEEVVGGRYLLNPERAMPASTYKHEERMRVTVTKKHPVAWLGTHPKARVVYIQLGHGSLAHHNTNYQRLVHNAIM